MWGLLYARSPNSERVGGEVNNLWSGGQPAWQGALALLLASVHRKPHL